MALCKTKIDWPGLSYTWSPIIGCANGCPYCYAKRLSDRFKMIPDFTKPQFFPERLVEPMKLKKPSTIFVGSMCDIFSEGVEKEWILLIRQIMIKCPQHTFMLLTKKPERYIVFYWPQNCWLGTTVELKVKSWRISRLVENSNNKKYLSIEPINGNFYRCSFIGIDLIIIGADSTRGTEIPPLEWVKSINHPNIYYKANLRKHYPELINKPKIGYRIW